jgi:hypothetical protein
MVSVAKEVNAIFNNLKDHEPQRINLEKSNESLPSKGNGIESQINHNGYIFNIFFYWIKYHNNLGLHLVVNLTINFSDFLFMVVLMCAHTKHAQTQNATIDRNAKHA